RRIGREPARVGEEAEEAAHGGELARDRDALGGAIEGAQPVADGGGAHARGGPAHREELAHVAQIGTQRVGGRVAFGAQMTGPRGEQARVVVPCGHAPAMLSTGSGRDKVRMRRGTVVALYVLAVAAAACRSDPHTARGTAELFLDAHYVRIDLPATLELTARLARPQVEEEMELVKGQVIDESTRKPTVHYTLLEEHPDGEAAVNLIYRGSITVEDADRFERRWLVTVRRQEDGWRVTNYQELGG